MMRTATTLAAIAALAMTVKVTVTGCAAKNGGGGTTPRGNGGGGNGGGGSGPGARRAPPPRTTGAADFQRGVAALKRKPAPDYLAARDAFADAAKKDPKLVPAWIDLGLCHLHLGDLERARQSYERAHSLAQDDPRPALGLAEVLIRAKKHKRALTVLDRLLRARPKHLVALGLAAMAHRLLHQHAKSLKRIQAALAVDPKSAVAYDNFGHLYLAKKDYQTALMIFDRGLRLKKNNGRLAFGRGLAWLKTGHVGRAVFDWEHATRLDPGHVAARMNLGKVYIDNLDYRGALGHYAAVLHQWPTHLEARLGKARALFGLKKFKQAAAIYEGVAKENPKEPRALFQLGKVYQDHLEKPARALVYYQRFVKASPGLEKKDPVFAVIKMLEAMTKPRRAAPRPPARR